MRIGTAKALTPHRPLNNPRWELPAAELAPLPIQPPIISEAGERFTLVRVHRDQQVHSGRTILAVRPDGLRGRLYLRLREVGETEVCLAPVVQQNGRLVDPAGCNLPSPADQAAVVARYPYGTKVRFAAEALAHAISLVEAPPPALPEPRPLPALPSYLRLDTPEKDEPQIEAGEERGPRL